MPVNFPASHYAPEYLPIHRRALKNSIYGAGNIIKAEIDSGRITYVMNSTGIRYSTYSEAFDAADVSGLTGFARLSGGGPGESGSMRGLLGFNERIRSMKKILAADADLMERFGIKNIDELTFTTGSARIPQDAKEAAKNVLQHISQGRGFMFQTKDSGTFLRAFVGEEELSSVGLNELLYKTSGGFGGLFSNEEIAEALKKGKLGGLFQKAPKRFKGVLSLDGMSLTGDNVHEVDNLLSLIKGLDPRSSAFSSFGESIKIFDTEKDFAKIAIAHLDDTSLTGEDLIKKAMAGLSPKEIDEAAAYYGNSGALESALGSMKELGIISRKDAGIAEFTGAHPEIEEVLRGRRDKSTLSEKALVRYNELMEQFKRPADGFTLLNKNFIEKNRINMQAQLKVFQDIEAAGSILTPEQIEKKQLLLSDIQNSQSGMDAETIRFYFTKDGRISSIKGVASTAEFDPRLSHFSTITTLANIKKESALTGETDIANIILKGESKGVVFVDPLAPAFHGEIFSSPEVIQANAERGKRIVASYQAALQTGEFDADLQKDIYRQSKQITENLPVEMRTTAERSKMYATELVRALESGVDIRQQPRLSNYLMHFVNSQIARQGKNGAMIPIMEDVFRFSLNSEFGYYAGRTTTSTERATLKDTINYRLSSGGDPIGLGNFKLRGHDMLTSGHAANIFHNSLGTFDMDDSGIPMMKTMNVFGEGGESLGERIGFFTFRQPTGPGEYVLSVADFDTETIRGTFGRNKNLVSHLNDIVAAGTADLDQQILHRIVSPEVMAESEMRRLDNLHAPMFRQQDELHLTMIKTMEEAQAKGLYTKVSITKDIIEDLQGQRYGSVLAMDKTKFDRLIQQGFSEKQLVSNYTQGNLYKLFAEQGAFSFEESSIKQITDSALFDDAFKEQVQRLSTGGNAKEIQAMLGQIAESGNEDTKLFISNLAAEEFNAKQLKAAASADPLGMYINRLAFTTAQTRQSQEIMKHLDPKDALEFRKEYKIGLIDPDQAIDYAINVSGDASVNADISARHYEVMQGSIDNLVRTSVEEGADMEGVVKSLAKLTGRTGSSNIGVLSNVGAEAVEATGRSIGAQRAMAYARGIEDTDLLASMDQLHIRNTLRGKDNHLALEGLIAGFEEKMSEIDPANELANKFIASLRAAKGKSDDEVNSILRETIGVRSGKYAAPSVALVTTDLIQKYFLSIFGSIFSSLNSSSLV
jgi:hypothetical protein